MKRPELSTEISATTFREFYYLKKELMAFCKQEGIQTSGNKEALTNRIAHFLDTGEKLITNRPSSTKNTITQLHLDDKIEDNFICSQNHRAFFKKEIGKNFSFNVTFQNWLKQNSGKTYKDSIEAYYHILEDKKHSKTKINKQFEYNTYIRDFFEANKNLSLQDDIRCWRYIKSVSGHNRYEEIDLKELGK